MVCPNVCEKEKRGLYIALALAPVKLILFKHSVAQCEQCGQDLVRTANEWTFILPIDGNPQFPYPNPWTVDPLFEAKWHPLGRVRVAHHSHGSGDDVVLSASAARIFRATAPSAPTNLVKMEGLGPRLQGKQGQ